MTFEKRDIISRLFVHPDGDDPLDSPEIMGLTADSRAVEPGYLFAALSGTKADGSQFIADAVMKFNDMLTGGVQLIYSTGTDEDDEVKTTRMPNAFFASQYCRIRGISVPQIGF